MNTDVNSLLGNGGSIDNFKIKQVSSAYGTIYDVNNVKFACVGSGNDCLNGGICNNITSKCDCLTGFGGTVCEKSMAEIQTI